MGQSNIKSNGRHQGQTKGSGTRIHTDKAEQLKSRLASGGFEAGPEIAATGQKPEMAEEKGGHGTAEAAEQKETATLPKDGPAILSQRHQQIVKKDNFYKIVTKTNEISHKGNIPSKAGRICNMRVGWEG